MSDPSGILRELREEIAALRQKIRELEDPERERKRVEEALRAAEEKYQQLFDNSPTGLYQIDFRTGRFLKANRAICDFFGVREEDLANVYLYDFLTEQSRQLLAERLQKMASGEEVPVNPEYEIVDKNGARRWIQLYSNNMYDEHGSVIGADVVAHEITERKRAEETLRKSEELLGRLIAAIPDMVVRTDVHGEILFVNGLGVEISGYEEADLIGRSMFSFIAPEDQDKAIQNTTLMMEQRLGPKEYHLVTKDGKRFLAEVNGDILKTEAGDPYGMVYIIRDISDRKRAEEALRVSESKYRLLTDKMADIVWMADMELRILYVTPSVETVLGFTQEERMRQTVAEQLTPDSLSAGLEAMARELALEKAGQGDPERIVTLVLEYYHKDGSTRWMETIISGIRNEHGVVVGLHGVSRDITARRQAEEERDRLQAQLNHAQRLESIGTLAGGVAHDFNNLLMGVQGDISLMMMDLGASHRHYETLKRVEGQVQSGAHLARQLLGFARGGLYEIKPADMNEILDKTSALFGRTKKEIAIQCRYARDLWSVEVDQGQMEQVFLNLYVNAWHAMPGGGQILLETENVVLDEQEARPLALTRGKYVKITVADTGTGMDEKTMARIFDPFFTTKEMGRGTGLGLATVYGIITGHKGSIHVESELGRGSIFTIFLPASERQVPRDKKEPERIAKGTETILLVDDEAMVLDVSRRMLEYLGYRVHTAASGQEAISLFREKGGGIDLVILDMIMPGLSGSEVFDQFRQIDPGVKVCLASGYSIDGQAQQILERGCNGFLQKPFKLEQLSRKVREILG